MAAVLRKAYILLADGFEETEAIVPYDILKRGGVDVQLVSIYDRSFVFGCHGVMVDTKQKITDGLWSHDLIVLPGGMPGALNLADCEKVAEELKNANEAGKYIAAICAAPMVLGKLGLLKGKRATCYPGFEKELDGAVTTGEDVVVDGKIITAIGPGADFKFGLKLLELLTDSAKADLIKKQMILR